MLTASKRSEEPLLVVEGEQKVVSKMVALLKCGSCRFAAYYFLSFYVAILDSGFGGWRWLLFSAVIWLLHSLGTELVNRLSDETEDRINRPERTALCDVIGFRQLRIISYLIWAVVALIDVAWLILQPNLVLAVLLALAFLAGINYSYGVRFKRKRHLSLFALTFPFAGPFIVGWSVYHPVSQTADFINDAIYRVGPFVAIVGLMIGSIASTKDITDIKGDEQVGYLSLAVSLIRRNAIWAILGLISIPFVVIILFVSLNLLPQRFLLLLLFMPVSLLGALCIFSSTQEQERQAVKEAVYHYWFVLLATALYLYLPKQETLLVILGTAAYWFLTSQYLHWSGGIRLWKVQIVLSLLRHLRLKSSAP